MARVVRLLLVPAALVLVACGSSGKSTTPTACFDRVGQYLAALRSAPSAVRLGGSVAISDCFNGTQGAGDQADVGQTVVQAATRLNSRSRRDPGGAATVQLGYLDGAVHEGASHASGIYADLVRRVDAAARFDPGGGSPGAAFERAFGKGYAAGESTG